MVKINSTHPLYQTYYQMIQRCYNENADSYPSYGGRDITVCDEWLDPENGFQNFIKDMGDRPIGRTLDRINPDGSYTPTNCRWATQEQQNENKRNTVWIRYRDEDMSLARACRLTGLHRKSIYRLVTDNVDIQEAFEACLEGLYFKKQGKTMTQVYKIIKHILITGSITQREAIIEYGTQSFHRRIADVREAGFPLINKQKINPVTQAPYTRYEFANKATYTKAAKMFQLAKAHPWS